MYKILFLCVLACFSALSHATEEQTSVTLSNKTIIYDGSLSKEANDKVRSLIIEGKNKIKWLSITSKGGEVNKGMDLGELIYKYKIGVEVNEYCLSSCANYVFSAAPQHKISNHALIGFHGGVTGMKKAIENYLKSIPESKRESVKSDMQSYIATTVPREAAFFKKNGVNQEITILGQSEKYQEFGSEGYSGWYYSLNDLKRLGVKNITVINPPWSYKPLSEKTKFFRVSLTGI